MSYHYKSGAQKRKERKERQEKILNEQRKQPSLTSFNFNFTSSSSCTKHETGETGPINPDPDPELESSPTSGSAPVSNKVSNLNFLFLF